MFSKSTIHFDISERKILLRIFDVLFVLLFLSVLSFIFNFGYGKLLILNILSAITLGFYLNIFGTIFEMYNLQTAANQLSSIKSIVLTTLFSSFFYLFTPIFTPSLPDNRLQIIYFTGAVFLGLLVWRLIYIYFLASDKFVKKVVFICEDTALETLVNDLIIADNHYLVEGFVNTNTYQTTSHNYTNIPNDDLVSFCIDKNVSEIIIAINPDNQLDTKIYESILSCLENGMPIKEYSDVFEQCINRIPVHHLDKDFYKYFPFSRNNQNKVYRFVIRFFDIFAAFLGLLFLGILIPFIWLGNLFGNRGQLFYTQKRVGKNRKSFKIYKFRSMVADAEKNGAVFATQNDSRITPFGKFLRKSRLDEIPQFINVFKGEMSVIGPRPERPIFVDEITKMMPFYQTRHIIKPGLTGWAQVSYPYGSTLDDSLVKLQYDLFYIKHRSLFLDVNIILKTIGTVLFYKGQ